MTRATKKARELREELYRCDIPHAGNLFDADAVAALNGLCRAATTYQNIQCERCNGTQVERMGWDAWEAWTEKEDARLERLMERHADSLGLSLKFQGDPRGATVKVVVPNDPNGYGLMVPGS